MPRHCIALFSGGLDSLLAMRLMTLQGIRVTALHSVNCFHGAAAIEKKKVHLRETALALGAEDIVFPDTTETVIALTKQPRYGYGRHLNACIDCRMFTVQTGFRLLQEIGADFVVSGEVIGQRPMSQRKDAITLADRAVAEWGFKGLFLRPLCAKLLEKTIPEKEGWVDPGRLFDISGRSRDKQMALAAEVGLESYPTPAGGCLLTDPGFGHRLADLMRYTPDWDARDAELLKIGRHFIFSPAVRLIVSRSEKENYALRDRAGKEDRFYINAEKNGAIAVLRGEWSPEAEAAAAGLAVHYSKSRGAANVQVESWRVEDDKDTDKRILSAASADPDLFRERERALTGGTSLKMMREKSRQRQDAPAVHTEMEGYSLS